MMYERFTERAKKVLDLAQQEAQRLSHEYIGTEHMLLGLVKEGSGVAANVLRNMGVDFERVRLEVEKIVQSGPDTVAIGTLPQTPRAKKVIEYAIEEAQSLGHNYVGTEHLLLGLLREHEGVAACVLMMLGLELDDVREEVLNLLGAPAEDESAEEAETAPEAGTYSVSGGLSQVAWSEWVREAVQAPEEAEVERRLAGLRAAKTAAIEREDYETALKRRDEERALRAALPRRASLRLLQALLLRPDDAACTVLLEAGLDIEAAKERIGGLLREGNGPA